MVLKVISTSSYYSRSNHALAMALERIPSKTWTMLARRNLAIHPQVWNNIRAGVKVRNFVMDEVVGMTGLDTCDNDLHTDEDSKFYDSKECSGCHSVVYCSEACQKSDWATRHRYECDVMRRSRYVRRRNGVRYSQAARHFHTKCAWFGINNVASELASSYPQGRPINEFIIIVNNTVSKLNSSAPSHSSVAVRDLNEHLEARRVGVLSSCPAADERYWKIINDYRLTTSKRKRLAEAFFCYNAQYRIAILAEFEREGPASQRSNWKMCRSVVRFEFLDPEYLRKTTELPMEPMGFLVDF
ncbi:hypothetical protein CC2G_011206 [Coprinopsis cinerea AmutBmut pab1-1]|nr:hypothetical protein CC2G_011206 [Coprinopsis cinerea AmutBmut pab1-1]